MGSRRLPGVRFLPAQVSRPVGEPLEPVEAAVDIPRGECRPDWKADDRSEALQLLPHVRGLVALGREGDSGSGSRGAVWID